MSSFYEKTKRWDRVGVTVFSLLFMTVGFLQICSLTFGKAIISWVQWPTVALGAALVLLRLVNFKRYKDTRGILIWALFAVSFAVSAALSLRYGFRDNARMFVFLVFQFALLYAGDRAEDPGLIRRRLKISGAYFLAGTTLLSLGSFLTMAFGFSRIFYPQGEGPVYYVGFHYGRLFGIYWDPNIGALTAVAAAVLSLHGLLHKKGAGSRVLFALSLALQVSYVAFSGSRTGQLTLCAGTAAYALISACAHAFSSSRAKQAFAVAGIVLAASLTAFFLPTLIQRGGNAASRLVSAPAAADMQNTPKKTEEKDLFDREYDLTSDVTNRRTDIWRAGLEVFGRSPVFGVSRANILPYVDDNLPESYLVTNDHMRFDSMHNTYVEILVSQGALGLALFLAGAGCLVVPLFGRRRVLVQPENAPCAAAILGILAAVMLSTLVIAEIVYVISPVSTLFWLSAGALDQMLPKRAKKAPAIPAGSEEAEV